MTSRSTSLIPTWVSLTFRWKSRLDEALVAPRVEPAQGRVVHRGVRMALAADDDVGLLGAHDGDEVAEQLGRDVAVGVDEAEIAPAPHPEAGPQRGALADVGGEGDPAHDVLGEAVEREGAAVGGAVGDGDDLEGHARRVEDPDHVGDRPPQAVARVVVGDDDRDVKVASGSTVAWRRGSPALLSSDTRTITSRAMPRQEGGVTPPPRGISAGQATRRRSVSRALTRGSAPRSHPGTRCSCSVAVAPAAARSLGRGGGRPLGRRLLLDVAPVLTTTMLTFMPSTLWPGSGRRCRRGPS